MRIPEFFYPLLDLPVGVGELGGFGGGFQRGCLPGHAAPGVSCTKAINKRFGRVGALFQDQFHGRPVKNYEHLLSLCAYIHANPVKDGLAALLEDWEYSNFLDWIGLRSGTLVNRDFIQEHFGTPAEYKSLMMNYLRTRALPDRRVRKYLQDLED